MNPTPRSVRGFTLVELIVIVFIISILAFFGLRILMSGTRTVSANVTGDWSVKPATIPAAPATGSFTYYVQSQVAGGTAAPVQGRVIKFTLGPSTLKVGTGHIVSITNGAGAPVQINAMNGEGTTDAAGNIVVEVTLESKETANMVSTDATSGKVDPPIIFSAQ